MKITIVTDAWKPQVNGVVTTLQRTGGELEKLGHRVSFVTAERLKTFTLPTYPSIRLALRPGRTVQRALTDFEPDAVHIVTEGPLGLAARAHCRRAGLRFTTSYHTQFPEYLRMRVPVPLRMSYACVRWFHSGADRTMVPTESQRQVLSRWGFRNLVIWPRGVDTELFRPRNKTFVSDPRPICLYAGRVAVEKNLEAFLSLDLPGTKYVIGDGPDLRMLRERYPQVRFPGFKYGEELAGYVAAADVFVFPSRTDTFGLVLLEAMACAVPVAAYPVTGPIDVVKNGVTGILDEDLGSAVRRALVLDGNKARTYALAHSWAAATEIFAGHLSDSRLYNAA